MDESGLPLALLRLGENLADESPGDDAGIAELAREACQHVAFWLWTDDWDEERAKLRARQTDYLPRAERWLAAQSGHPWEASLRDQRQFWVSAEGVRPQPNDLEQVGGYFGIGAFWPAGGGLVTSTEVAGMPSPLLEVVPNWPRHVWGLRPVASARVFEVRTPADLQWLVSTYPCLAETESFTSSTSPVLIPAPFYVPDWSAVSREWDAVRFTMAGKLATAFALLPVADGYTMLIDEDGSEVTLWFRWSFIDVEDEGGVPGRPVRSPQLFRYEGPRATWPAQLEALRSAGWREVPLDRDPGYARLRDRERYALLERQS